jgi:hypothetical protein
VACHVAQFYVDSYLIFLRLLSERDEQASLVEKNYQRIFSGS